MPKIELVLPKPHAGRKLGGQKRIIEDARRFNVLCCGRRFGKTDCGEIVISKPILGGLPVGWFAPTYKVLDDAWQEIKKIYAPIIKRSSDTDMVMDFVTGARLEGWSMEKPGSGKSRKYATAVIDEAALVRDLEYQFYENIRPTLTDYSGGAWMFSTPQGFNDFHAFFKRGETDPDWRSWQMPTSENPYIRPEEIEAARKEMPALIFRQNYEAEFVQLAGAMFRREYFTSAENAPKLSQCRFWDLAATTKTQGDYSVGARGGLDNDGRLWVTDVVRGRWEWPALIRIIRDTALSDGPEVGQIVETAGTQKGMLDLLQAEPSLANIAFRGVTPSSDKITRAQPVLARAEQGKLVLIRAAWNAALIDEFCAFPQADHDDQVDAVSGVLAGTKTSGWFW